MSLPVHSKVEMEEPNSVLDDNDFELVEAPLCTTECNPTGNNRHNSNDGAEAHPFDGLMAATDANAATLWTNNGPVFHAGLDSQDRNIIFNTFVAGLPNEYRQIMACSTCRRFLRRYGNLCMVGDDGSLIPLLWPLNVEGLTNYCRQAVLNVAELFKDKLVGDELKLGRREHQTLGKPVTGVWNHFSLTFPHDSVVYQYSTSGQNTEKSYEMLDRILTDNSTETIARAHHLIHDNQLPYAVSHRAPISYLRYAADKLKATNVHHPTKRRNFITKLAREAYLGCLSSLRSGMIGYLLECVREGQQFERLKRNWEAKANPVTYLRPIAAPSAGNIEAAEQAFAKLGFTPEDLRRVFLTMDRVPASAILWSPRGTKINESAPEKAIVPKKATEKASDTSKPIRLFEGLLQDLESKPERIVIEDSQIPCNDISFRRFVQQVLPNAISIEYQVNAMIPGYFFTTGRPGTKPIMNFHTEGSHTASWYTYSSDRTCGQMGLNPGWVTVKSIISFPHMWDGFESATDAVNGKKAEKFKFKRLDIRYLFILDGAAEKTFNVGLCLFPMLMRQEFHGVRKTVEAFSDKGTIEQPDDHSAQQVAGIVIQKEPINRQAPVIRVRTVWGQESKYKITLFE